MERMMTEPTLTDAAIAECKDLINKPLERSPRLTCATAEAISRFARAIGSRDPLRLDTGYAARSHWGVPVGYQTMLYCFDDTVVSPGLPGLHRLYGAVDWEFMSPIRADDCISAVAKLVDVSKKETRFAGPTVVQKGEVEYRNQHGALVGRSHPTVLRFLRSTAVQRGKYGDLSRYAYRPEELDQVWEAYQQEEVRGGSPRYWDDVLENEQLAPMVKGPLTTEDNNAFVGCVSGTLAFSKWLDYVRRYPDDVYWDPEFGVPDSWQASLLSDTVAQAFGFPAAHDTGLQRVAWMEHLLSNWMGDMGFLRRLSARLTAPTIMADCTWVHARVIGKALREQDAIVQFELWCDNQRGERTAIGTAEVLLPARRPDIPPPLFRIPARSEPVA